MVLEIEVTLNGIFSIITVIVSFIVGLTIAAKYKKYKQKTLLFVAFTSIGIYSAWWASSLSFIIAIFNSEGLVPFPTFYFSIVGLLTTPTIITWMLALDSLLEKNNKRRFVILILSIETSIIEVIYLITAVINPLLIGELNNPVDVTYHFVGIILFLNISIIITSFTVDFSLKSMKSTVPEVRLKGIIILISALLFLVCTFSDAILPLDIIGLTIIRILLILSALLFYCGFLLPNFLKKILVK